MKRTHRSTREVAARVLTALVVTALVLAPTIALARLGGGTSFKMPGSSGGGGGGLDGFGFLLGFMLGSPAGIGILGVIVVIVIILAIVGKIKGGSGGGIATGANDWAPAAPALSGDAFAQIKAEDPGFSEEFFYSRVNEMFATLQNAWMQRNMDPVRRFLSDQQFTVLQAGVQQLILQGRINMLAGINVERIDPVSVSTEGDFDSIKLAITAKCIDYTIDERTKEIVNPRELGDGKTAREFMEYWTLIRKKGALSKPEQSVQKCPNCGAPITDGNYVKCAYCGFMMNDATLDWVLTRIEQVV